MSSPHVLVPLTWCESRGSKKETQGGNRHLIKWGNCASEPPFSNGMSYCKWYQGDMSWRNAVITAAQTVKGRKFDCTLDLLKQLIINLWCPAPAVVLYNSRLSYSTGAEKEWASLFTASLSSRCIMRNWDILQCGGLRLISESQEEGGGRRTQNVEKRH